MKLETIEPKPSKTGIEDQPANRSTPPPEALGERKYPNKNSISLREENLEKENQLLRRRLHQSASLSGVCLPSLNIFSIVGRKDDILRTHGPLKDPQSKWERKMNNARIAPPFQFKSWHFASNGNRY
jgi:hypothetical protein